MEVNEDETTEFSFNIYEVDGNATQIEIISGPNEGTSSTNSAIISSNLLPQRITFGSQTVQLKIADVGTAALLESSVSNYVIDTLPINDPPTAVIPPVTVLDEDTQASVAIELSDVDNDLSELTIIVAQPSNGTCGTRQFPDHEIVLTPFQNVSGTQVCQFRVDDGHTNRFIRCRIQRNVRPRCALCPDETFRVSDTLGYTFR